MERCSGMLYGRAVNEQSFIELVDLFDKLRGMGIASVDGSETPVLACLVAAEKHEVVNA